MNDQWDIKDLGLRWYTHKDICIQCFNGKCYYTIEIPRSITLCSQLFLYIRRIVAIFDNVVNQISNSLGANDLIEYSLNFLLNSYTLTREQ